MTIPARALRRAGRTRPPMERIFRIHEAVNRGTYPNCRQLAEELGVTRKTVQRDVTFMREDLGLPLAYHELRWGYFYEKPVGEFPVLQTTVEDVVALFLARQALAPLQGSPLEATLSDCFRRLSSSLQGQGVTFQWSHLDQAFSTRHPGMVAADLRLFEKLARAVLECRAVAFRYRKIDSEFWEARRLRPFHLAEVDGGWYVIGHDPARQGRRTFAFQRIKGLRVLQSRFARPADFDLGSHLGGSFGVWNVEGSDKGRHRVRLRFRGWAARVVSERRWHPSQEIRDIPAIPGEEASGRGKAGGGADGEIEMTMELSNFEEIIRWILSWGAQAEIIEPPELRERVVRELGEALRRYPS